MIIGITGLIGTGKSTVARFLQDHGAAVHCADHFVHDLYQKPEFLKEVGKILGLNQELPSHTDIMDCIADNPDLKAQLEAYIHPMVRADQHHFLKQHKDKPLRVLDIPLLYETNAESLCDQVWVTHCSYKTQKARVLERPNFNDHKFETIVSWQRDHRARADHVIDTDKSIDSLEQEVKTLIESII